jgi:hypothetical protein
MKGTDAAWVVGAILLGTSFGAESIASAQTIETRVGRLTFDRGLPTKETVERLYDEMDFQRAVQCYLWGLPTVALEEMKQAHEQNTGAGNGDAAIYEGYRSVSVLLTPNLVTTYIIATLDLAAQGPMVLDYPAGATAGAVVDWWDRPVTDVGQPGPDKGEGAKYLFVGPGQDVAPSEVIRIVRSRTFKMIFFFRVLETDPQRAQALQTAVRIYPYGRRDDPPETRFLRPRREGTLRGGTPPAGLAYWERLAQALTGEVGEDRDRFFAAMLKPLGIERNRPFRPDARQRQILEDAAQVGEALARASAFATRLENRRYRADSRWEYVFPPGYAPEQDVTDSTLFEERTGLFYETIGMSSAALTRTPGVGQALLALSRDADGAAFDGGRTYRLRIPPRPPARRFWSITLYDIETRRPIQNAQQIADRSSRNDLVENADGSIDLYFAPAPPSGVEKNWIPTVAGRTWFTYFRLFGPLEPYLDRSWPLPDIALVEGSRGGPTR